MKGGTDAKEGIYAGAEGIRTPDPLLAKPRIDFRLASENVLECFIKDKKNTKGLTTSWEEWLRDTVGRFLRWLPVPLPQVNREHVVRFLGFYTTKPWRKHAFYRANKSFIVSHFRSAEASPP